jgi:hypothetical protein
VVRRIGGGAVVWAFALVVVGCASSSGRAAASLRPEPPGCTSQDLLWRAEFSSLADLRTKIPGVHQAPELSDAAATVIVVYANALPIGVAGGPNGSGPLQPTSAPGHRDICLSQGAVANYYVDVDVPNTAP